MFFGIGKVERWKKKKTRTNNKDDDDDIGRWTILTIIWLVWKIVGEQKKKKKHTNALYTYTLLNLISYYVDWNLS